MSHPADITTTARETFTYADSCAMAVMVYRRFGRDIVSAAAAWCRMLQNSTTETDFEALVIDGGGIPSLNKSCCTDPTIRGGRCDNCGTWQSDLRAGRS